MNQFFQTTSDIEAWLQKMRITKYKIAADLSVSVDQDVAICIQELDFLPVQFSTIKGHFDCSNNKLLSLKGCPHTVQDSFYCTHNQLKSLEHCPQKVGASFFCDENMLTSLKHCPNFIPRYFSCNNNLLRSFENGPEVVYGYFLCTGNPLETMLFCPRHIEGRILLKEPTEGDHLTENNTVSFDELYVKHLEELRAHKEKKVLQSSIPTNKLDNEKVKPLPPQTFKL